MTALTGSSHRSTVSGAGLGLRRELVEPLLQCTADAEAGIGFLEIAPENWMELGGRLQQQFRGLTERFRFVTHGLSLSIGGPAELDIDFLRRVKRFLDAHGIADYTEHLSWCADESHLYDLLPIPFTNDAVRHVAERVRIAQDILERRIALENASFYLMPPVEMSELDFICNVLQEADCDLLLDVNNIVVNACNHGYDARAFLAQLPLLRIRYVHIAGHLVVNENLRIDTHGADVGDAAWDLLDRLYQLAGPLPTLLERDFNIPPLDILQQEIARIRQIQQAATMMAEAG